MAYTTCTWQLCSCGSSSSSPAFVCCVQCAHVNFCCYAPQVKLGLEEVATDLFRVKPYVYSAPDNTAVIVFSGEVMPLMQQSHTGASGVLTAAVCFLLPSCLMWAKPLLIMRKSR